jgi:L-threonylcarbamoyladenylate synthase
VIVFPTDTLYGLGTDALNEEAISRVYEIKGRDFSMPLLVLIGEEGQLRELVPSIPPIAQELIGIFWPGPLTLILQASAVLPPRLLGGSSRIGVRLPASPLVQRLAIETEGPITGTSANFSGHPTPHTAREVLEGLGKGIDLTLDGGPCASEKGSTLLDVTRIPPLLLREGELSEVSIEKKIGPLAKDL